MNETFDRDERTLAVEGVAYRWAYLTLSYGLLAAAAYRSFARADAAWDLLALVVVGGAVHALYQGAQRVLTRRWAVHAVAALALAALVAAGTIALRMVR
mgnify:CR=1 FL=1